MSRLRKRVRIGKYAIPALLLASLAIGTVAAAAYVILTYTMTLTVTANPRVHFWDGAAAANTMDITMNIFPNITTIDEDNADWDIRSTGAGDVYIRVSAMDNSDVTSVTVVAYETVPATALFNQTWTASGTFQGPYTTSATNPTDYNLWIEVEAAGTATDPAEITFELKVESP